MSYRQRPRRVEQVLELRRSRRLSERHSQDFLLSTNLTPSSRDMYVSNEPSMTPSIVNESGQSVPLCYEEGGDAQRTQLGTPQHLYGLDVSDGEESDTCDLVENRSYHVFNKERVLHTPSKYEYAPYEDLSFCGRIFALVITLLYKFGSLLYLTATAVLCLDVTLLNRMSCCIHPVSVVDQKTNKSFQTFWILPVTLCGLIILMIGLGAVPDNVIHQPPMTITLPMNYTDESIKEMIIAINTSLQEQLTSQMSVFKGEVKVIIEEVLSASESKLMSELEKLANDHTLAMEDVNVAQEKIRSDLNMSVVTLKDELIDLIEEKLLPHTEQLKKFVSEHSEEVASLNSMLEKVHEDQKTSSINSKDLDHQLDTVKIETESLRQQLGDIFKQLSGIKQDYEGMQNSDEVAEVLMKELNKAVNDSESPLFELVSNAVAKSGNVKDLERAIDEVLKDIQSPELSKEDIQGFIDLALTKYDADRTGKCDFALESAGGSVITSRCSKTYAPSQASINLFGIPLWIINSSPRSIIQPDVNPGSCWAFEGSRGHAVIKLSDEVIVDAVTLEHIPKELSSTGNVNSAPADFSVWGMTSLDDNGKMLGVFTYQAEVPVQEFQIINEERTAYSFIKFQFLSNHGSLDYTCVYRVRVHGSLAAVQ